MNVFLVTPRPDVLREAVAPLCEAGLPLSTFDSLAPCLEELKKSSPASHLVILDLLSAPEGRKGLREAAMQVLAVSAFSWVTAVSSLPEEEFHDAMEGLGMIMPLPEHCTRADGERLLGDLRRLTPTL